MNPFGDKATVRPPILPLDRKPEVVDSPRIERLRRDGDGEGFWREIHTHGAPLIEPAADPGHSILTFVWRGDARTRDVLVVPNRLFDRTDPSASRLRHLEGTDVWHLSYRLPSEFRCSYRFCVDEQGADEPGDEYWLRLCRTGRPDPYGTEQLTDSSVVALPRARPQPWLAPRPDVPRGKVTRHVFESRILGNRRPLWTYEPPVEEPSGLLVMLDGQSWFEPPALATILDNMVHERRIRPVSVIGVHSLDQETRTRELCCNDDFVSFLTTELPEWAAERLRPADTRMTISGQSFGALTALYAGLRAPEHFEAVIAQSPSLWWSPDGRAHTKPAWLSGELAGASALPSRIHLTVGDYETGIFDSTRELSRALRGLGRKATITEFCGGHDFACWRAHLSDGLLAVAR
ncbi:MAG: alpha/beta hydrolase-fold protein [Stackebrandtia sp.]